MPANIVRPKKRRYRVRAKAARVPRTTEAEAVASATLSESARPASSSRSLASAAYHLKREAAPDVGDRRIVERIDDQGDDRHVQEGEAEREPAAREGAVERRRADRGAAHAGRSCTSAW
jgi:hypothetical protein